MISLLNLSHLRAKKFISKPVLWQGYVMSFTDEMFGYHDKTVVITGGAGLIAGYIAEAYLRAGAAVSLWDLNRDALEEARRVIMERTGEGFEFEVRAVDCGDRSARMLGDNVVRNFKTYRILRGVRVLAIGGEGIDPGKVLKSDSRVKRLRTYRSITIELPEDVSIQLANVLTHVSGGCWVELRPIGERKEIARINPELSKLAEAPARPLPGEMPGLRGGSGSGGAVVPGGSTWE